MNIGFIGIGKIASAVIEGLCTSELKGTRYLLSPRNEENSKRLAVRFSSAIRMENNQAVVDGSGIVFLALRPTQAVEALKGLTFRKDQVVVSLIPLIGHAEMTALVAPAGQVVRAIPLPPVIHHDCPIPVFHPIDGVVELLDHIGQTFAVSDEKQLHAIWTLTCLITPYYDLLNELGDWSVEKGVCRDLANRYLAALFSSLSNAAVRNPVDFNQLAKHAATPGGMNEQTGKEIQASGTHDAWVGAAERMLGRFPHSDSRKPDAALLTTKHSGAARRPPEPS